MQGNRNGRNQFYDFGDPFSGFGGFGGQRSLASSFFGGRDPFDDPFFTRPFGGGMFESNFFGPGGNPFAGGMLEPNFFGSGAQPFSGGMIEPNFFNSSGNTFPGMQPSGFLRHEARNPHSSRGLVIEELNSNDEKEEGAEKEARGNSRTYGQSSNEPLVEVPDDKAEDNRSNHLQYRVDSNRLNSMQSQPQNRSFTYQSSSVTYGGGNGAYYTSSRTRRAGSDGVTFEEIKEADSSTGQATHRQSRGLHNKGHSVRRKLNSDGRVDTMQTLHNLDEDELPKFEEVWKGNARRHLPGLNENFIGHGSSGSSGGGQNMQANRGGWALPSTQRGNPYEQGRRI